jgi:hypothetical protein
MQISQVEEAIFMYNVFAAQAETDFYLSGSGESRRGQKAIFSLLN